MQKSNLDVNGKQPAGSATVCDATTVIVYAKMRARQLFNQRKPLSQRLSYRRFLALFFGFVISLQVFNVINLSLLSSRIHHKRAQAHEQEKIKTLDENNEPTGSSGIKQQNSLTDARQSSAKSKDGAAETGTVVCVDRDIEAGQTIPTEAIYEQLLDKNKIPDDAVSSASLVVGHAASYGLSPGSLVTADDIYVPVKHRKNYNSEAGKIALAMVLLEFSVLALILTKFYGLNRIFLTADGIRLQFFGFANVPVIPWSAISTVTTSEILPFFGHYFKQSYKSRAIELRLLRSAFPMTKWWLLRLAACLIPDAKFMDLLKREIVIRLDAQAIVHDSDRRQFINELEKRVGADFINPAVRELAGRDEETTSFTKVWLDSVDASGNLRGLDALQGGDRLADGAYQIIDQIAAGGQAMTYTAIRQALKSGEAGYQATREPANTTNAPANTTNEPANATNDLPSAMGKPAIATSQSENATVALADAASTVKGNADTKIEHADVRQECAAEIQDDDSIFLALGEQPCKITIDGSCDGQLVVLKEFVLPDRGGIKIRNRALANIEHEATLLQRLDNSHVVKLVDSFVQGNRAYLVMEKIDGRSLRQLVQEHGCFEEQTVTRLAQQMCDILQYLHEQKPPIVHRDFTPDNLLLKPNKELVLIDFNVADQLEQECTQAVVGKHCYMPPEQFRGHPTPQSDIYAMGATLHYLLTGDDPEPISVSHPRAINSDVSEWLDSIIAKATSTDASKRYLDARALKEDLFSAVSSG